MDGGRALARRLTEVAVERLASGFALALRGAFELGRPWARFARLSSLRARTRGCIPVSTQFDGDVETAGRPHLELGGHVRLGRRVFLETCGGGVIRMGERVRVNAGTFIVSYASVTIGRDSLIGEYVSLRDADHGLAPGSPISSQPHTAEPIVVGEGVWIGRGAVILKGVTVGDGAVVAANSVVTRDVPPMTIVAGVPARPLRTRSGEETRPAAGA